MIPILNKEIEIDSASFRDPSGHVFHYKDKIYRVINEDTFSLIKELKDRNILTELIDNGFLIPTDILSKKDSIYEELKSCFPAEQNFLSHRKIPMITYPYEWSYSMLVDAAILTLKLQLALIRKGYSLKDATAYNIQFINCKPVFIDILSIEKSPRLDIWIAYGQFCKMFLYPLLLNKFKNFDIKGYYLSNINGMDIQEVTRIFGISGSLRPLLFLDIFLPYLLGKKALANTDRLKSFISKEKISSKPQEINLRRLLHKIESKLKYRYKKGYWINYMSEHTYPAESEREKKSFIKGFLDNSSPKSVLDLGSNTGQYSRLAAESGANVIAVDSDHDCINHLYEYARDNHLSILPIWTDLTNTSPAIGFENTERKSFLERINCECVFALALLHHLLITSRIPLYRIRDYLYKMTGKYLVIEFIDNQDLMFQKLLALRENLYDLITYQYFADIFSEKFDFICKKEIKNTKRTLVLFRKK